MLRAGERVNCAWVVETTKGPHACSFQAAVQVHGHAYCKTHAKQARKIGRVGMEQAAQRMQPPMAALGGVAPTQESLELAKAILALNREGSSAEMIGFLIDGFVANQLLKMSGKRVA